MKKIIVFLITLVVLLNCVGCTESSNPYGNKEYEVISVEKYTVITGKDENGPVTTDYLVFIYLDNGEPNMVKKYKEVDSNFHAKYIVVGDTNKYVIVHEYRNQTDYLYLTQETYDRLFNE